MSYLETLKLANNPNLQGTLPFSFFFSEGVSSSLLPTEPQYPLSSNLKDLDLSHTALSGTLPSTMLDNLDELEKIDLSYSRLSGNMLDRMFRLSSLRVLNLQNNTFEGTIPEFKTIGGSTPMELQECWLDNNQLIGRVPSSLYDTATNLSVLSLSENFLSGTLPGRKITKLSHLRVLNVDDNLFRGKIPTEIGVLDSLRRFSMHFNILSGAIPSEVGRLSQLRYLNVGKNNLNGLLPNELSNLSSLAWLSVQDNQLIEGTLPSGLSTLSTLSKSFACYLCFFCQDMISLILPLVRWLHRVFGYPSHWHCRHHGCVLRQTRKRHALYYDFCGLWWFFANSGMPVLYSML